VSTNSRACPAAGGCSRWLADLGSESGAPTDLRYYQVWSFRGGKVIRLENFRERAEALEAAGLRE
jgi:ketosteroid isomerase-like protein